MRKKVVLFLLIKLNENVDDDVASVVDFDDDYDDDNDDTDDDDHDDHYDDDEHCHDG